MDNALSKEMRFVTIIVQMKVEQKECRKILTVEFPKYLTKNHKMSSSSSKLQPSKDNKLLFCIPGLLYVKKGIQNSKSKSNLHSKAMWHPSPLEPYQGVKAALTRSPDYPGNECWSAGTRPARPVWLQHTQDCRLRVYSDELTG